MIGILAHHCLFSFGEESIAGRASELTPVTQVKWII
jgi:hypothetical protein